VHRMIWSARPLAAAALVGMLLTGCSNDKGSSPTTGSPSPSASGQTTSAKPSPTPAAVTLPASCEELVPFGDLDKALGKPLFGETVYIKGQAQPAIHRTGRVTCRYGIRRNPQGKPRPALLEIGVSGYTDAESATKRVQATVSASRSSGASTAEVTVDGTPGFVLINHGESTLVFAQGNRTVAVTLGPGVVAGDKSVQAVTAVGTVVARNLE